MKLNRGKRKDSVAPVINHGGKRARLVESSEVPLLYMVAGPNGAGKTTTALALLPKYLDTHEFINADSLAYGLNPLNPAGQAIAAGRLMISRFDELIEKRTSFAFETTGSARTYANRMRRARDLGFRLGLLILWLPDVSLAENRVASRVSQGGHNVEAEDIRRRYRRGLQNLREIYMDLVDEGSILDASGLTLCLVAQKQGGPWKIADQDRWACLRAIQ